MIPEEPNMLLGFVNMKLRDFYGSLEALCDDLGADRQQITDKLRTIQYRYEEDKNRFVPF